MSHDPQRSGWCKLHCNKPCWIAVCSDNAEPFSEHYRTISIFIDFPFASKEAEAEVAWQHPAVGFLIGKVINGRESHYCGSLFSFRRLVEAGFMVAVFF